jgi:hypothetical protein
MTTLAAASVPWPSVTGDAITLQIQYNFDPIYPSFKVVGVTSDAAGNPSVGETFDGPDLELPWYSTATTGSKLTLSIVSAPAGTTSSLAVDPSTTCTKFQLLANHQLDVEFLVSKSGEPKCTLELESGGKKGSVILLPRKDGADKPDSVKPPGPKSVPELSARPTQPRPSRQGRRA